MLKGKGGKKMEQEQDKLNTISSFTSKLLRKNFGKGPQSCQSTLTKNHLVIYIRGFISPMEEVLIKQGQRNQVQKARTVILNYLLNELKGVIELTLDQEVKRVYHDWNFPNNSGAIMLVLDEEMNERATNSSFQELEAEVARISELVQKVPDKIFVYPMSSTIYLVERVGILIMIEKALVQKGFTEELKITKDELEKEYFHRQGRFGDIFNRNVIDIFIDWDIHGDRSLMVFILKDNK